MYRTPFIPPPASLARAVCCPVDKQWPFLLSLSSSSAYLQNMSLCVRFVGNPKLNYCGYIRPSPSRVPFSNQFPPS